MKRKLAIILTASMLLTTALPTGKGMTFAGEPDLLQTPEEQTGLFEEESDPVQLYPEGLPEEEDSSADAWTEGSAAEQEAQISSPIPDDEAGEILAEEELTENIPDNLIEEEARNAFTDAIEEEAWNTLTDASDISYIECGSFQANGETVFIRNDAKADQYYRYNLTVSETGIYQFYTKNGHCYIDDPQLISRGWPAISHPDKMLELFYLEAGRSYILVVKSDSLPDYENGGYYYADMLEVKANLQPVFTDIEYLIPDDRPQDFFENQILVKVTYTVQGTEESYTAPIWAWYFLEMPSYTIYLETELYENGERVLQGPLVDGTTYTIRTFDTLDSQDLGPGNTRVDGQPKLLKEHVFTYHAPAGGVDPSQQVPMGEIVPDQTVRLENPGRAAASFLYEFQVPETGVYQILTEYADSLVMTAVNTGGYDGSKGLGAMYCYLEADRKHRIQINARELMREYDQTQTYYMDHVTVLIQKNPEIEKIEYRIPSNLSRYDYQNQITRIVTYSLNGQAHTFQSKLDDIWHKEGTYLIQLSYGFFDSNNELVSRGPKANRTYTLKTCLGYHPAYINLSSPLGNDEWVAPVQVYISGEEESEFAYDDGGNFSADGTVWNGSVDPAKPRGTYFQMTVPETGIYQFMMQNAQMYVESVATRDGHHSETGLRTCYAYLTRDMPYKVVLTPLEQISKDGKKYYADTASLSARKYPTNIQISYKVSPNADISNYRWEIYKNITYTADGRAYTFSSRLDEERSRDRDYLFEFGYGLFDENGTHIENPKAGKAYTLMLMDFADLANFGKLPYSEENAWFAPVTVTLKGNSEAEPEYEIIERGSIKADGTVYRETISADPRKAFRYQLTADRTGLYQFYTENAAALPEAGQGRGGYDSSRGFGTHYVYLTAGKTYPVTLYPREVEDADGSSYKDTVSILAQPCPAIAQITYVVPDNATTRNYHSTIRRRITYTTDQGTSSFECFLDEVPATDGPFVMELGYALFDENGQEVDEPQPGVPYTLMTVEGYDLKDFTGPDSEYMEQNSFIAAQTITLAPPTSEEELDEVLSSEDSPLLTKIAAILSTPNEEVSAAEENGLSMVDRIFDVEKQMLAAGAAAGRTVDPTVVSGMDDVQVDGAALTAFFFADAENSRKAQLAFSNQKISETSSGDTVCKMDISLQILNDQGQVLHTHIQPQAPLRITMPVPEELRAVPFLLYHYVDETEQGSKYKEIVPYERKGDHISFVVYGLSTFSMEESCDHVWEEISSEKATCTKAGKSVYHCSSCGRDRTVKLAKLPHKWGEWSQVSGAAVSRKAVHKHTCKVCGTSASEEYGSKLAAFIKVTDSKVLLKKGQKTKDFKVSMAAGDSVREWKIKDKKIASVSGKKDGTCTIKGLKAGKSTKLTITLTSGKKKTVTIQVQKSAVKTTSVSCSPKTVSVKAGGSLTLKPIIKPFTSKEKVTFKSLNTKVVTVGKKNGKVTAKAGAKGKQAKIEIRSGKKNCKVTIKVK